MLQVETGAGRRPGVEIAATQAGGGGAGKPLRSHSRVGVGLPRSPWRLSGQAPCL